MSVLNLLSEKEKDIFISYIKTFGAGSDDSDKEFSLNKTFNDMASADHLLRCWDRGKSCFLESLFKDNLIIKFPIEYEQSFQEIDFDELYKLNFTNLFLDRITNGQIRRDFWHQYNISDDQLPPSFIYEYNKYRVRTNYGDPYNWCCHQCYNFIYDTASAYNNIYDGETFIIEVKGKKPLKITQGTKYSKAVGKISKYLDIPDEEYEEWRNLHSLLINTKSLKGNLCLSIHPMDYITMSDATFSSCMNWMEKGDYRRGTVEMMNSSKVIVAYLECDGEKIEWDNEHWNMKKWRTLLIAEPNFIASIKAYPYSNDDLTIKAIDLLASLYPTSFHEKIYPFTESFVKITDSKYHPDIEIHFDASGAMYCDMGLARHFLKVNTNYKEKNKYYCEYCGPSECMFCGEINGDFYNESCVFCEDCMEIYDSDEICYCDNCGCRVYNDDATWTADRCYCPACASQYVSYCVNCGEAVETEYNTVPTIISYKGINNVNKISNIQYNSLPNYANKPCTCKRCVTNLENLKKDVGKTWWNTPRRYEETYHIPFEQINILGKNNQKVLKLTANNKQELVDIADSCFDAYSVKDIIQILKYQSQVLEKSSFTDDELTNLICCD